MFVVFGTKFCGSEFMGLPQMALLKRSPSPCQQQKFDQYSYISVVIIIKCYYFNGASICALPFQ